MVRLGQLGLIAFLAAAAACTGSTSKAPEATLTEATETVAPSETETATATIEPSATATDTPDPLETSTPASTATVAPFEGDANARIITDNLNVRVGPSADYMVIGQFRRGQEIEVVAGSCSAREPAEQWLVAEGLGWFRYEPEWVELGRPPSAFCGREHEDWRVYEFHEDGTRTGIPDLDQVIEAALEGDVDVLLALVRYRSFPCTQPGYPDSIRCPDGEPLGTVAKLFPFGVVDTDVCCGFEPDAMPEMLMQWTQNEEAPLQLIGVTENLQKDGSVTYGVRFKWGERALSLTVGQDGTLRSAGAWNGYKYAFYGATTTWILPPPRPSELLPPP